MAAADKDKMRGLPPFSRLPPKLELRPKSDSLSLSDSCYNLGPPAVRASISVVHLYRPLPTQCMHKLGMGMDFKGRIGFFVRAHFSLELR